MKRWIRLAARLYPAPWRDRYDAEFDALLDDAHLRWSDVADVLQGAAIMRMTKWNSYWKVATATALAGAILACTVSLTLHDRWMASASITMSPGSNPGRLSHIYSMAFAGDPFVRNIRVVPEAPGAIRLEFVAPDRMEAQATLRNLTSRFVDAANRLGDPPVSLLIWDPPPARPIYPNRPAITLFGAFAGLLTGSLALLIWRRAHRYSVLTVALPDDIRSIVARRIAEGPHRDPAEYIRALIDADGAPR